MNMDRPGRHDRGMLVILWAGGQVKPFVLSVGQGGQPAPVQNARLIIIEVENDSRRRTVEEMEATDPTLALDEEPADPAAGDANQVVLAVAPRKDDEVHQALGAAFEVTAQPQETLSLPAEGI